MDPLYRPRMEFIAGRAPEPQGPIPPPGAANQTPAPAPGVPSGTPAPAPGQQSQTAPADAAPVQPTNGAPAVSMPKNPLNGSAFSPNQPPIEGPPQ
jgi:hypothetical protein